MIFRRVVLGLASVSLLSLFAGCASTKKGYSDTEEKLVVGSKWSDTDNQEVARAIVKKVIMAPWISSLKEKPRIGVGKIRNLTSEDVDTTALVNFMQDELINSGKVTFVANDDATRADLEKEMAHQETRTKSDQRAKAGKQSGVGYFLQGDLSSKVESDDDVKYVNYQANFKLVNLESSDIVWSGQHRLRKKYER